MERDVPSTPEREKFSENEGPRRGRRYDPTRSLWNPFELVEGLLYLVWGLGKLLFHGTLDL